MTEKHDVWFTGESSKAIALLRFPMAILIMLFHASFKHELRNGASIFDGWNAPCYFKLDYLFVDNICMIAVPLFFVISGFLFFYKVQNFSIDIYMEKMRKRCKSLLVPYVIWNVLILLLYLVVQNLVPSMQSGRTKPVLAFDFFDILSCFWSMKGINGMPTPIDGPLWFIRDLIVMSILSPFFYWTIKRFRILIPVILLILYVAGAPVLSCCFFSIGAYFGICKIDFISVSGKFARLLFLGYLLVLLGLLALRDYVEIPKCVYSIEIILGVFMAVGGAFLLVKKGLSPNKFLAGSTFFLFASHNEILKMFIRLTSRFCPLSDVLLCVAYFLCPFLACVFLLFSYKVIQNTSPKLSSVLSGGR